MPVRTDMLSGQPCRIMGLGTGSKLVRRTSILPGSATTSAAQTVCMATNFANSHDAAAYRCTVTGVCPMTKLDSGVTTYRPF
ncbi:hypothetical protein TNCV_281601 [Trichonephila clavipes]|nr:hypothetical protein TNCV_281601 [Trichonephila clavipes]